jgi:glutathione S-transferase
MVPEVYPNTFKPAGEARDQAIDKAFNEVLPRELTKVEKALGKKKFLLGESLSIADFYWGSLYVSFLTNP